VENYFQNYVLLRKRLEVEKNFFCSANIFIEILKEEFEKKVTSSPKQIYGNWKEFVALYKRVSFVFFNPANEIITKLAPHKSMLLCGLRGIGPFVREYHTEFLWFLEKERFLLNAPNPDSNLTANEKKIKDRAVMALKRNDREKALYLFNEATSRFPHDFTMYGDMAFLYLNDRRDTQTALEHIENACKRIPQKDSLLYCFLKMVTSTIYRIEGDYFSAYNTTKHLKTIYQEDDELDYRHAINAIKIEKNTEGLHFLEKTCKNNIAYAMKIYEEVGRGEYYTAFQNIFNDCLKSVERKFFETDSRIKLALNEALRLEIGDWGKVIIPSLRADFDILSLLSSSKTYVGFTTAEYFIAKTPAILILESKKALVEKGRQELRENSKIVEMRRAELEEKILERKNYNVVGIPLVCIGSAIFFIFLSLQKTILFAFFFSTTFALVLFSAIAVNSLQIKKLRENSEGEIVKLCLERKKILSRCKYKIQNFVDNIKNVTDSLHD